MDSNINILSTDVLSAVIKFQAYPEEKAEDVLGIYKYNENAKVDWGDGTITSYGYAHKYLENKIYTIKIYNATNFQDSWSLDHAIKNNIISLIFYAGEGSFYDGLFKDCYNLEEVKIYANIESISMRLFERCSKLKNVYLPNSVTKIGLCAFEGCSSLEKIIIPEKALDLRNGIFSRCESLVEVTLPNDLTEIPEYMFEECYKLQKINVPNKLIAIGRNAFYRCFALPKFNFPDSLTTIGGESFCSCYSLTSVTIPENVTSISKSAFGDCPNLNTVYWYSEAQEELINSVFKSSTIKKLIIGEYVTKLNDNIFNDSNIIEIIFEGDIDKWSDLENELSSETKSIISEKVSVLKSKVEYETNGGTIEDGFNTEESAEYYPDKLPICSKDGMIFEGWFLDSKYSKKVVPGTKITSNTIYAKFYKIETFYKIKLDLVHNTINNFVHVMQYDDGVAYIRAEIYKDWQHVYPSEEFDSAELRLKKHDGAWIKCNSVEPYIPVAKPPYAEAKAAGVYYYYSEGSYILVTSSMTEQEYNEIDPGLFYKNIGIIISLEHDYVKINVVEELTDIPGGCPAVIDLYSADGHIQTAKFVLDVDRNPIQTGETVKNVPEDISAKLSEMAKGIANTVKVTPQTLTDEEKAQARANIGVGASDLNIENGTGVSSIQQKGVISDSQLSSYTNPGNSKRIQSQANGKNSFSEGSSTLTRDEAAHAEGMLTYAEGSASHTEGGITQALNYASHAEGHRTISREFAAHAEGERTEANGHSSHAEGMKTKSNGHSSHAEGNGTTASGIVSHAGGAGDETMTVHFFEDDNQNYVKCSGNANVVFGQGGEWVQVTGLSTDVTTSTFYGWHTPSEVFQTFNVGDKIVIKYGSRIYIGNIISKGVQTNFIVSPHFTSDLVNYTGTFYVNRIIKQEEAGKAGEAKGAVSFVHGNRLVAGNDNEAVFGKYNQPKVGLLFDVGNGTDNANRSNAFEVYSDGHAEVQTQGTTEKSVAQVKFVKDELNSYLPQIRLSSSQVTRPMERVVHDTYTEHKITFQLTAEQAGYVEDNSKPIIKLQLSQHIPYIDGDYLYLQRNVIQTLSEREVIQFTFNNARFNFDEALTQGYVPMTEIGDGAAIYDKSTKTLFVSFVETSPKKVEDAIASGGGGGSQLYLHILENEDQLAPCAVITFRRDSYLKGDLRTSSWGAAIADDSLAIKVSQYLNDAYTAPFEYGNFYNSFYCRFHADVNEYIACMTNAEDVDPYYAVTSDTVYKINNDGTVTAL